MKVIKANVNDLRNELWLRKREMMVWETRKGDLIPLKEMKTEHLINAINYFEDFEEIKEIVLENQDYLDG